MQGETADIVDKVDELDSEARVIDTRNEPDAEDAAEREQWRLFCEVERILKEAAEGDACYLHRDPRMFNFKVERLLKCPGVLWAASAGEATLRYYLRHLVVGAGVPRQLSGRYADVLIAAIGRRHTLPLRTVETLCAQYSNS